MSEQPYWCAVCQKPFSSEPHTLPDGEDCHAECCPACRVERGQRAYKAPRKERKETT